MNVEGLKKNKRFKRKLKNLVIQLSSDLVEFETISLLVYLENVICNLSIYFIFFLDFRGRMYTISTYGPVSNKIIRNILVYNNNYDLSKFPMENEKSQVFQIIKKNYFSMLNSIKLKNDSDIFKSSLF
jgi:DNA-directed RNA polymerase